MFINPFPIKQKKNKHSIYREAGYNNNHFLALYFQVLGFETKVIGTVHKTSVSRVFHETDFLPSSGQKDPKKICRPNFGCRIRI